MLKLWTIQKPMVLDTIEKEGIYRPDFSKSDYLSRLPGARKPYTAILNAFNELNNVKVPGLIFSYMGLLDMSYDNEEELHYYDPLHEGADNNSGKVAALSLFSYDVFRDLMEQKRDAVKSMWDWYLKNDCKAIFFEKENDFNPIYLEVNSYAQIIEPEDDTAPEIYENIKLGKLNFSVQSTGILHAHCADIKKDDIVEVHDLFSLF